VRRDYERVDKHEPNVKSKWSAVEAMGGAPSASAAKLLGRNLKTTASQSKTHGEKGDVKIHRRKRKNFE